ncbi:DNA-binding GntR family transcriptional regulator [Spinactinospora alkalitolerans]|uniref:DNA-binding GntR family transcriptional regulator n=1 Tax=Spinactinospora alkalitolerans TaxID=687207 RepID=A0A852U3J7_9ACTN|nr:GntR family transcriptional regulator [Spinactinospora alkalitolerans]NYE50798.1 DNA-binding GntR family transcriptional regulator [Spinactinospora alkalitolerans]
MSNLEFAPPKYVQIVQAVQERIEDGTYPVGEMLPSESRMVREFGAGRSTVVRALQILSMRGWIEREHGRGSFVKGVPEQSAERSHAGASAFDAAENPKGSRITGVGRASTPATVADALKLPENSPAIMRQRVILDDGSPSELVTLWFPLDVASGTDLAEEHVISIGVREHLQAVKQLRPARISERLSARLATEQERELLQLDSGTPVLGVIASILDASEGVIAVADVVLPGDLHELEDNYPAS